MSNANVLIKFHSAKVARIKMRCSACRSDQVNVEMKSPAVGKLTYALWKELKNSDKVNNDEFMRRIRKFVNRNTSSRPQQPEMTGEDINKYNITDILSR